MEQNPKINRKNKLNVLKNEKMRHHLKIILAQPIEEEKRKAAQDLHDKMDEDKAWLPKARDLTRIMKILKKKPKKEKKY